MPVYFNFVCDKQCPKAVQPVIFDAITETWGDVLEAIQSFGWNLEIDGAEVKSCVCPECKLLES